MGHFFICEYQILEQGLNIGFHLYSTGHLIWLAGIAAAAILFSGHYRKTEEAGRARIRKIFAILILLSEIYKDTVLIILGAPMMQYLPLHLCSFAIFGMLIDAFSPRQNLIGQMFAYAFFPGAMAALLFCNWTCYPFWNFMNIHSFVFHGWIVCYVAMRYRSGEIRPTYRGLWQTSAILIALLVPIYFFDKLTGQNYMFLNEASEGSPLEILWKIFGTRFGEPGYLISYIVLALAVFHVLYGIYAGIGALRRHHGTNPHAMRGKAAGREEKRKRG